MKIKHQLSIVDVEAYTLTHVALVRELVDLQSKQYALSQQHMQRDVLEDWYQTETELTRERGLWGPTIPSRYYCFYLLIYFYHFFIFYFRRLINGSNTAINEKVKCFHFILLFLYLDKVNGIQ